MEMEVSMVNIIGPTPVWKRINKYSIRNDPQEEDPNIFKAVAAESLC